MELLLDLLERCKKLDIRGWRRAKEELAALREAGETMAQALQDVLHDRPSAHTDNVWENVNSALEAWEAANK